MHEHSERELPEVVDVVIVGGGIAGLTAAALVARAGRSVTVVERSQHWGGRAATQSKHDIHFNLGAHALYCHGHTFRLLKELQVPFSGAVPNPGQSLFVRGNAEFPFPLTFWSLATSRLLSIREKWTLFRFLSKLPRMESARLDGVPLGRWIEQQAGTGHLAAMLRTLFRLNTYVDDVDQFSAGAAIAQLQLGLAGNVWYVDGGWQSLVDGLRNSAQHRGAVVRSSSSVEAVRSDPEMGIVTVSLSSGEKLAARSVILAVPPRTVAKVLALPADAPVVRRIASSHTARAACLDICLDRLSRPNHRFTLGLDRPVYFSVHSSAAKLAPEGLAVVHLMKYLRDDKSLINSSSIDAETELESLLDQMQPGWRAHVVERRFLPNMVVTHAIPLASEGGLSGRMSVCMEKQPGVYLAGDWIGARGMLVDASAASAEEAALAVFEYLDRSLPFEIRSREHAIS